MSESASDNDDTRRPLDECLPRPMAGLVRAIDAFADWSGWLISWLIVPLIAVVVLEVAARYVFGTSIFWAYDISYMLYGSFFMLGAAYTLRHNGHIRTDFLYSRFSVRWQGFVDTVAYLLFFFPGMAIFFWFGWESFLRSWQLGEQAISSSWMPPIYPFRAVIPIAAVLLLIQGISELLKSLCALVKGRWP